jgi:putative membrane protein
MPEGPPIIAAFFAWLHLASIGLGAGLLLTEHWLCRRLPDRQQVKFLGQVDLGYQLALIGSLATGLARALYYGQDAIYYLSNRLFWLKIAVFVILVAIAIGPTLQYIRWNREARSAPAFAPLTRDLERVRAAIALGLGLWLILPLIAILVARGYGLPDQ